MTALPIALVHLDESCLGNGQAKPSPGGAAGLVEEPGPAGITRRDFQLHAPDTTNNRMALSSAIAALQLLHRDGPGRRRLHIVSDSEYLVKGITEWVPGWKARGWRRKAGPIENLELWQALERSTTLHETTWGWVRGHQGHPKNEYANDLAVAAAERQRTSEGLEPSGFAAWLEKRGGRSRSPGYDPDAEVLALTARA